MECVIGDDDEDIDAHFGEWKEKFWQVISRELLGKEAAVVEKKAYEPSMTLTHHTNLENNPNVSSFELNLARRKFHNPFPKEKVELATIVEHYEARPATNDGSTNR
eukprot:UN32185